MKKGGKGKKKLFFFAFLSLLLLCFLFYTSLRFYFFIKIPSSFSLTKSEKQSLEEKLDFLYPERNALLHSFPHASHLEVPEFSAVSAVLLDFETGEILFEKNADKVIPPASLTKLFVMYVILSLVDEGKIALEDKVPLPPAVWASHMPPRSSLMFLGRGQKVTIKELLTGLAVSSGNDAAYALALYTSGSMEKFLKLMNKAAASLNLTHTYFVEPSGYSEENTTTAREMAAFSRFYIQRFPFSLTLFHSLRSFSYPKSHNLAEEDLNKERFQDFSSGIPDDIRMEIHQENTNPLLGKIEGADGLKTGYIDESGYNLVFTAKRGNMRIISVTLGGAGGRSFAEGQRYREADARSLAEFAFSSFMNLPINSKKQYTLPSLYSSSLFLPIVPLMDVSSLLVPRQAIGGENIVQFRVYLPPFVKGAVKKGEKIGRIDYKVGEEVILSVPLVSAKELKKGNFVNALSDGILSFVFFRRAYGK